MTGLGIDPVDYWRRRLAYWRWRGIQAVLTHNGGQLPRRPELVKGIDLISGWCHFCLRMIEEYTQEGQHWLRRQS